MFITLEGGEGCGKSTVAKALVEYIKSRGKSAVYTREPGGVEIAESIRNLILDTKNTNMASETEALLYAASRAQHLKEKVIPALNEDTVVVCDRFIDSSLAYQGYARGLGIDKVYSINKFAIGDLMPDLTIYLDVDPEVGLTRVDKRLTSKNRLDLEELYFHKQVRQGYYNVIVSKYNDNRIVPVDANRPLNEVIETCVSLLKDYNVI